jgi:hypothetical protein
VTRDGETGAVTAEFAVALPAVVAVLALCLGAVGAVSTHTTLTSLAVDSARVWARGESWETVQARVRARQPQATAVGTESTGFSLGERCVSLSMPMRLGSWIELGVVIEETACAPIEP